jgi:hypothetical protein
MIPAGVFTMSRSANGKCLAALQSDDINRAVASPRRSSVQVPIQAHGIELSVFAVAKPDDIAPGMEQGKAAAVVRLITAQLILKRASASRSSGEWSDDDHDVLADGVVVGRIMKAAAAPVGTPWLWTLAFRQHEDRMPREAAMAAFAKSWRRE